MTTDSIEWRLSFVSLVILASLACSISFDLVASPTPVPSSTPTPINVPTETPEVQRSIERQRLIEWCEDYTEVIAKIDDIRWDITYWVEVEDEATATPEEDLETVVEFAERWESLRLQVGSMERFPQVREILDLTAEMAAIERSAYIYFGRFLVTQDPEDFEKHEQTALEAGQTGDQAVDLFNDLMHEHNLDPVTCR